MLLLSIFLLLTQIHSSFTFEYKKSGGVKHIFDRLTSTHQDIFRGQLPLRQEQATVSSLQMPFAPYRRHLESISLFSQVEEDISTDKIWKWRGHNIFAKSMTPKETPNDKPTVILLHGFGASSIYWRETIKTLHHHGYQVHALDLLGQGRSSKPTDGSVHYSINLWANMVDDYAAQYNLGDSGVVLMGNSLGSLVALSAATGDFKDDGNDSTYLSENNEGGGSRVKGICLFNCAIGLNSFNILKNPSLSPIQRKIYGWLFGVLNALIFGNEALLRYALNSIVTKELLSNALKGLYCYSPDRVDEELVDSFYYPAVDDVEGAVEAIRQIYTNDPGMSPMEMHEKHPEILDNIPLHLIWGSDDVVTPITGDVGTFYCDRVANNRSGKGLTTLDIIESGHIPFDDNPVDTHERLLNWLKKRLL